MDRGVAGSGNRPMSRGASSALFRGTGPSSRRSGVSPFGKTASGEGPARRHSPASDAEAEEEKTRCRKTAASTM